jgi:Helix-turn-helix
LKKRSNKKTPKGEALILGLGAEGNGILATHLRKALDELGMTPASFASSKSGLTRYTVANVLNGHIPKPLVLESLSRVLGIPLGELSLYACLDLCTRDLQRYGVDWEDVSNAVADTRLKKHTLPVYAGESLREGLSKKGYPEGKPLYYYKILTSAEPYSYGFVLQDKRLSPRVPAGHIAVVSPSFPRDNKEVYGVVGSRRGIFFGIVNRKEGSVIVATLNPYSLEQVRTRDIAFVHHIADTIMPRTANIITPDKG